MVNFASPITCFPLHRPTAFSPSSHAIRIPFHHKEMNLHDLFNAPPRPPQVYAMNDAPRGIAGIPKNFASDCATS